MVAELTMIIGLPSRLTESIPPERLLQRGSYHKIKRQLHTPFPAPLSKGDPFLRWRHVQKILTDGDK
jgi:hypothetical protein